MPAIVKNLTLSSLINWWCILNILIEIYIFSFLFTLFFTSFLYLLFKIFSLCSVRHLGKENLKRLAGPKSKYTKYLENRNIKFIIHSYDANHLNEKWCLEVFLANTDTKEYLLVEKITDLNASSIHKLIYFPWMRKINVFLKSDFTKYVKTERDQEKLNIAVEKELKRTMKMNREIFRKLINKK